MSRNATSIYAKCLTSHVRGPLFTALLCKFAFAPPYFAIARWWRAQEQQNPGSLLYSDRGLFVAGTMVVHAALYIGIAGFFHYCDRTGLLSQYKMHRVQRMGPSDALLHKTWLQAAVGQLIIGPLSLWVVAGAFLHFGSPPIDAPLPALPTLYVAFLVATLGNSWGFYWSHRLLHVPALYAKFHKQHHTYTGTVGYAAEFAHPLEQLLSNQGPTVLGCLLLGSHWLVWFSWLAARLKETYEGHSGYCFKGTLLCRLGLWDNSSPYHDFHHSNNSGNFAGNNSEYLDHLFGTQDAWVRLGGVDGYLALRKRGVPNGNALFRGGKAE